MSRKHTLGAAASLAAVIALVVPMTASTAEEGKGLPLRLRAFAVDTNTNIRPNPNAPPGGGVRSSSIDIVIERWSTPEEIKKLQGILVEEGDRRGGRSPQLLSALQAIRPRCGFARTSTSLGWDLHFARETALPEGGRRIVVATDRPIGMWEATNSPRSRDYEFSLAEIRLSKDGTGEGKAITMAQLRFNTEDNTLEIENYQTQPVRLNQVTVQ